MRMSLPLTIICYGGPVDMNKHLFFLKDSVHRKFTRVESSINQNFPFALNCCYFILYLKGKNHIKYVRTVHTKEDAAPVVGQNVKRGLNF
jgi:hypothetical protein